MSVLDRMHDRQAVESFYRNSCGDAIEVVVSVPRVWSFIDVPLWFPMLRSIDSSVLDSLKCAAGNWDNTTPKVKQSALRSICS
jgi:hypothetical protein